MINFVVGTILIISILVGLPILLTNILYYSFFISPHYFLERPLKVRRMPEWTSSIVVGMAYLLSVFRLPFIIMPYAAKLLFFLFFRDSFKAYWSAYLVQVVRLLGDFVNFFVTAVLLMVMVRFFDNQYLVWGVGAAVGAELVRLLTEKGQTVVSGIWQILPHRDMARFILKRNRSRIINQFSERYTSYYRLSAVDRAEKILQTARYVNRDKPDIVYKLRYVNRFRIVPKMVGLRSGNVRDVARGEIFIHDAWTNDPWLLTGQLFRRSLWIFDPRLMKRPFYYRTRTNRLMTHFVLKNSRYTLPYCWYQFGQEIKVARYDIFFRMTRWLGFELEGLVKEDGSYLFDPLLGWFGRKIGFDLGEENKADLWCDEDVVSYLVSQYQSGDLPSDLEIALRFAYPVPYVQNILRSQIASRLLDLEREDVMAA